MKFTQLKYALKVAQLKNFSKAAQECNVSQPSLSVAIKNLEEELNTPLFERFKNDIQLTSNGEKLIKQIRYALEEVDKVKLMAASMQGELTGSFKLGAIYSVGPYVFPNLVPAIHQLAPKMTLMVEENFTATLLSYLAHGQVDAALVALPFDHPGMNVIPLYEEPFVAAVPKGHPWEERDDLSGDELADQKLLLLGRGHCFREQVLEICQQDHSFEDSSDGIHNFIEGNSLETIRHMVAVGTGITVLPSSSLENFLCSAQNACPVKSSLALRYAHFKDPVPSRKIALAYRSTFASVDVINIIIKAVMNTLPYQCRAL
jgi:LysR family transcriptional regulator, hydrogen peroxide-inducible genes activator